MQYQMNLTPSQKFHLEHLLYKKMKKFFETHNYPEIGFFHTYKDDLENYAIIDDLLNKKNASIYYSEINNNKVIFNQIKSLYDASKNIYGHRQFVHKKYLTTNLNIIVVPLQGYYNEYGLVYEDAFFNYLKNFKGIKLGYVNKVNKLDNPDLLSQLPAIKLDKIILI